MTTDQAIVFAVLLAALGMFAWGRVRYDLVALGAMLCVVIAGLIPSSEALEGFGHPAVITVAAVLIISHALKNAGIVDVIAARLEPLTEHPTMHIAALTLVVTVASAFMNNVGALAVMLPVALATAKSRGRSPHILLMPLAFGSILGGLMTMIGTPPNVIVAAYRGELTGQPFGMFDFSPVGFPVALAGVAFTALLGWRLIPRRKSGEDEGPSFEIDAYLTEVRPRETSPLLGKQLSSIESLSKLEVLVAGLIRQGNRVVSPSRQRMIREGDILVLRADPQDLTSFLDEYELDVVSGELGTNPLEQLKSDRIAMIEAVIRPGSSVENRTAQYLTMKSGYSVRMIGLAREGEPIHRHLQTVPLKSGDVLLLQGDQDTINENIGSLGLLPLADRNLTFSNGQQVLPALGIFAGALALGVFNVIPLTLAFILAVLGYALLGILPARQLYDSIDWPIIVLLAAMIPVGRAFDETGATALVASTIVSSTEGLPPWAVLTIVLVVTMFLSDVINNAATALVMAPIAAGIATTLGVSVDAFLMAVALGASCAFLTPIGHQSNTLVLGPGGYRFGDYWRLGLPIEILIVLLGVPILLWVWPL